MTVPSPPWIVRPAEPGDIPAMAAIRSAQGETPDFWERRIAGYLDGTHNPQHALPERAVFVADERGALVGLVAGHRTVRHDCQGELQWIDVVTDRRRCGIAGLLILQMAGWFVQQQALRVCVNVAAPNFPARALYAKYGAQPFQEHWMLWPDIRSRPLPSPSAE